MIARTVIDLERDVDPPLPRIERRMKEYLR